VSDSASLRDWVIHYLEAKCAKAQQIAACNAIHSGTARLCRWLLQAAECTGSDHLPLTQEILADMIGVRRTTVTLLAQELQRRGVIRYSQLTLLNRSMLEASACECYEAIKRENLKWRQFCHRLITEKVAGIRVAKWPVSRLAMARLDSVTG
jgi:hypothetical protein